MNNVSDKDKTPKVGKLINLLQYFSSDIHSKLQTGIHTIFFSFFLRLYKKNVET